MELARDMQSMDSDSVDGHITFDEFSVRYKALMEKKASELSTLVSPRTPRTNCWLCTYLHGWA